jgi:hypothetical protein
MDFLRQIAIPIGGTLLACCIIVGFYALVT